MTSVDIKGKKSEFIAMYQVQITMGFEGCIRGLWHFYHYRSNKSVFFFFFFLSRKEIECECWFSGGSVVKNLPASAVNVRDAGLIPSLEEDALE